MHETAAGEDTGPGFSQQAVKTGCHSDFQSENKSKSSSSNFID